MTYYAREFKHPGKSFIINKTKPMNIGLTNITLEFILDSGYNLTKGPENQQDLQITDHDLLKVLLEWQLKKKNMLTSELYDTKNKLNDPPENQQLQEQGKSDLATDETLDLIKRMGEEVLGEHRSKRNLGIVAATLLASGLWGGAKYGIDHLRVGKTGYGIITAIEGILTLVGASYTYYWLRASNESVPVPIKLAMLIWNTPHLIQGTSDTIYKIGECIDWDQTLEDYEADIVEEEGEKKIKLRKISFVDGALFGGLTISHILTKIYKKANSKEESAKEIESTFISFNTNGDNLGQSLMDD